MVATIGRSVGQFLMPFRKSICGSPIVLEAAMRDQCINHVEHKMRRSL